jgi:hypothetical protein
VRPDRAHIDRKESANGQEAAPRDASRRRRGVVETDADGHAAYEVHMVRSDGTFVTVYVDKEFNVVGVETGMPSPAGQPAAGRTTA